ncbi:hypothetical protein B0O99DRAFT_623225 [Bisporella sp. PMI_857]|nr:hypothetical protein B0O99DRAFT_623225 [Bisporella sp. PMI_857]
MSLLSPQPPLRILLRTDPSQLRKINPSFDLSPSFDQADTKLIDTFCERLSIDKTKISHLITRIKDGAKSEQVDIVFDYGVSTIEPQVKAYTISGSSLAIKELFNPQIRGTVNWQVEAYKSINFQHNREFPIRPDTRAATRKKRLAMRPT